MRYAEKVERSTLKMGATFVDYLPETGSWIFEVRQLWQVYSKTKTK